MKKTILFITALILTLCFAVGTASADSVTLTDREKEILRTQKEVGYDASVSMKLYYPSGTAKENPFWHAFLDHLSIKEILASDCCSNELYFFSVYYPEYDYRDVIRFTIKDSEPLWTTYGVEGAYFAYEEHYQKNVDTLLNSVANKIKGVYFVYGGDYYEPEFTFYETDKGDYVSIFNVLDPDNDFIVPIETVYKIYEKAEEKSKEYDGTYKTAYVGSAFGGEESISLLSSANITSKTDADSEKSFPTTLVIVIAAAAVLLAGSAVFLISKKKH